MIRVVFLGFLLVSGLQPVNAQIAGATDSGTGIAEAEEFINRAEAELAGLYENTARSAWIQANFITVDSEIIAAHFQEKLIAATMRLANESRQFDNIDLPQELRRKIQLLRTSLSLVAPSDPDKQAELTRISTGMESLYGRGEYCPEEGECRDLVELSRIIATSRDPDELEDAWSGWRTISPPMRPMYSRFVELANEGAQELGFSDLGELWRSGYDMPPAELITEVERLWGQVQPLYESLHCYVRSRLSETYGADVVPLDQPIPAHLLGNMWAQQWGYIYDLVKPESASEGIDVTRLLKEKNMDARDMVRHGEAFFTSLGFEPLPDTFWERSLFTKPADRDVVCHASAWNVDAVDDLRIKMCIEINEEDFITIHHELGHNFYQRAYNQMSYLYQDGAHDGFHEGIGDTIALSITPEYLEQTGLLEAAEGRTDEIEFLLRTALDKIAFLPFGLLVDQWRWRVFSGEIAPDEYNKAWWELRERYQGIRPPVPRSEEDFDPGAKYHIPGNTPYTRYFLAHILQFQFHEALCKEAGQTGKLHECSVYANKQAGERLQEMLEMGKSKPWPGALEVLTGGRQMDAGALLNYFEPLRNWLDEQNEGKVCGW